MKKAIFINFVQGDIEEPYWSRVTNLFENHILISRDDPKLFTELADADALFTKIFVKIDKELIDSAPNLKYISTLSTDFSSIDVTHAREKGVVVCNLGGYSTESVAEFAIIAMAEAVRRLEDAKVQARNEDFTFARLMTTDLKGKTLGVIGAGAIGSRIAEIGMKGFGMNCLYFARTNKPALETLGAKKVELDEVLSRSDYLAVAISLNDQTEGILNKERLGLIKEGGILVNIAPPKLMDQEAVIELTSSGKFTFIFDHSDDIDPELAKRFLKIKNVIVYPPVAFWTKESNLNKLEIFTSNIESFIKGAPQNIVS